MANTGKILVAAIDFGTTYSGYAFSFRHDFQTDPLKCCTSNWTAGSRALVSLKTPTTVLLNKDKEFEAFGYDAEDKYSQLADEDIHHDWYYFRRFKMMLYGKIGLKRNIMIPDIRGKEMPALTIFSEAINYLKNHLLKTIHKQGIEMGVDDIEWVLTVPAIWNDAAKQFMREAAEKAGIDGKHLSIALEPEAASLYCKHVPVERMGGADCGFNCFSSGSRYLVLDAGGGTVDITVHEVHEDGSLHELDQASGGDWGGTQVDEAFRQMLIKVVGNPVMTKFGTKNTSGFIDMYREFETKKRTIDKDTRSKVNMKIPIGLKDVFEEETEEEIQDAVSQSILSNKLKWQGDKLRMDANTFRSLFSGAIDHTVDHIKMLLNKSSCSNISTILMVGGFSEAILLQQRIREEFKDISCIIPMDAGLAVLKGAVIYGHSPKTIKSRKSRYTFGIATNKVFNAAMHPESKLKVVDNKRYCTDVFDTHIGMDENMDAESVQSERRYSPLHKQQKILDFPLYKCSSKKIPLFVTDEFCEPFGKMSVTVPDTKRDALPSVKVKMILGGTELKLFACEESTGEVTTAKFNFLGDDDD